MLASNIEKAVNEFGTPLYLYESATIKENFFALTNCFSKSVDVFYSLKANPNISISACLKRCGAGAEVSSLIELETALKAGFDPKNIIAVGPYKSTEMIKKCLIEPIYAIVCESKQEYIVIAEHAKSLNCIANVAIRINPNFAIKNAPLKMGGVPSQFGIDVEQVVNDVDFFLAMPHINLMGLHIYNGSRILDAKSIHSNINNILNLVLVISDSWCKEFTMIDIGGGLGIPYFSGEAALNLSELKQLIEPTITKFKAKHTNCRLILESGRFLVANAGMLICRVQHIKESHGKTFLITDAGTNCHLAAIGIGSAIKRNFPISTVSTSSFTKETRKYDITGPLCTPGDLLGKEVQLPLIRVGDLLAIENSGAYGPTASPVYFLSHGYPAEVMISGDTPELVRERDNAEDFLKKQHLKFFD